MTEALTSDELAAAEFPAPRRCPFLPPEEHRQRREQEDVFPVDLPSGQRAWLVTRHTDARRALDNRSLSTDMSHPNFPSLRAQAVDSPIKGTFMRQDGEPHMRVRRMLNREFTVRRASTTQPMIEKVVDDQLDHLEAVGAPADLVEHFALPVPSIVICNLLGVPYEDRAVFQQRTRTMITTTSTPDQVRAAAGELFQYLGQLVVTKMEQPGDDMISRFIDDQVRPGAMQPAELGMISMLLLAGAHETTGSMIASGTYTLLQHPDQLAELQADPSLMPGAVEELLRYLTVAQVGTFRVAVADTEIGGQKVAAGDGVVIDLAMADHDDRVWDHPERFDIHRYARQHVAFSHGPHNCVGQSLARLELQITFTRLLARLPGLRLAVPADELAFRPHTVGLGGVEKLPVGW